jgi:hypothetical protein
MSWFLSLETGDELISGKGTDASIKHHAVVIRYPNNPMPFVVDNDAETGVKQHSIIDYIKENNILYINRLFACPAHKGRILKRLKAVIGGAYHLFKFNCEHFANYLRFGKPESKQLRNFILGSVLVVSIFALVYALAHKSNTSKAA